MGKLSQTFGRIRCQADFFYFGRLSGEHRDNLIEYLPGLTRQWILLATDTEFGKEEAEKLRSTKQWGKVYTLESKKSFVTIIQKKDVETFRPVRSGK